MADGAAGRAKRRKTGASRSTRQTRRSGGDHAARRNNLRYQYVRQRGHSDYCAHARMLDRMYLGGGLQWTDDDREALEETKRKAIEMNEIADAVNTALGHQIANRVDLTYRPRGMGADDETAQTLSKVAMQVSDNNDYEHLETEVFADGLIQQRGYFEFGLDFDQNLRGEITLRVLDPMDVIPDPDAKGYNPDDWADVIVTRWLSLDEVEADYGADKRREIEQQVESLGDDDWGQQEDEAPRSSFGDRRALGALGDLLREDEGGLVRVRVIDRQYWQVTQTQIAVYATGDVRIIEDATPGQLQQIANTGGMLLTRPMRRVRWCVSTAFDVLLHDDFSPFSHFTVIPYFPFFRRGQTRGLVDNMVGPQELLNKALSQYLHIINTSANSGWIVEQNSLTTMSTEDLENEGAKTGLIVEYRKGAQKPEKITANSVPTGIDKLAELASAKIRVVSGISDAMRGQAKANQSGVAVQSLQFGSQLSLAVPLDNLARTRRLWALRLLELIQGFMTEAQVLRITERGADGNEKTVELPINWEQPDGSVLNDLTLGEYDSVVTEQPSQITFQNSQFEQAMAMRDKGLRIPDDVVVRYSNLADKNEVIKSMQDAAQNAASNPLDEARAALALAQATSKNVEALFSAIRTGQALRLDPALAGVADALARSAGFQDKDAAPIYPHQVPPGPPPPLSSHPLTPDNPAAGDDAGMTAVEGAV